MVCPWDRTKDGIFEAKHQCMLKNNVIISGKRELLEIGVKFLSKDDIKKN